MSDSQFAAVACRDGDAHQFGGKMSWLRILQLTAIDGDLQRRGERFLGFIGRDDMRHSFPHACSLVEAVRNPTQDSAYFSTRLSLLNSARNFCSNRTCPEACWIEFND